MRNANELHAAMLVAVQSYREAEQNVVLLFAEINASHAYRELGHASINEYMEREFGFSDAKTRQFLMLARAMSSMPELRREIQRARTARVEAPSPLEPLTPVLETMSDVRVRMDVFAGKQPASPRR